MTKRPQRSEGADKRLWPLTFQGSDVGLRARFADGRVRLVYLDATGHATDATTICQAFQLRGIGRHLAEIKSAISMLPLEGPAAEAAALPSPPPTPRGGRLYAHHVAEALEREEQ